MILLVFSFLGRYNTFRNIRNFLNDIYFLSPEREYDETINFANYTKRVYYYYVYGNIIIIYTELIFVISLVFFMFEGFKKILIIF